MVGFICYTSLWVVKLQKDTKFKIMKTLIDGTQVTSRSYYFLLDFNDKTDRKIMLDLWGIEKLNALNKQQYIYLFKKAMKAELYLLES